MGLRVRNLDFPYVITWKSPLGDLGSWDFGPSGPPTLERPPEKTVRSYKKPLKMSYTSSPKFKHTNFQVPGVPEKYCARSISTIAFEQVLSPNGRIVVELL